MQTVNRCGLEARLCAVVNGDDPDVSACRESSDGRSAQIEGNFRDIPLFSFAAAALPCVRPLSRLSCARVGERWCSC